MQLTRLVTQDEFFGNCCPIRGREAAQQGSRVDDTTLRSSKKGRQTDRLSLRHELDRRGRRRREVDIAFFCDLVDQGGI